MSEYASHLPALKSLSTLLPMRRVLEFGAGLHSTPFFLGLADLKRLMTVETNRYWFNRVQAEFSDERLSLVESKFMAPVRVPKFDLIFIDDGDVAPEREQTIRWVLAQDFPPTVIHDAEVPQYRALIEAAPNHILFADETPWTALVWR